MPGKVKVKVLAGRNLPVMDRSSDTTDAFVEVGQVMDRSSDTTNVANPYNFMRIRIQDLKKCVRNPDQYR